MRFVLDAVYTLRPYAFAVQTKFGNHLLVRIEATAFKAVFHLSKSLISSNSSSSVKP
jgi:hypothetical protein